MRVLGFVLIRSRQRGTQGEARPAEELQDKAMQTVPQVDVLSLRSSVLVSA
jgi:hypothetical protein